MLRAVGAQTMYHRAQRPSPLSGIESRQGDKADKARRHVCRLLGAPAQPGRVGIPGSSTGDYVNK